MVYNSYENDIKVYGDFKLPVPTYDIKDRKVDYSVLIAILLVSNANINEENVRYIEYSRLNKAEICEELGICSKTLDRKIKYLIEKGIISEKTNENGLIYVINYSKDGKYFVTIQHRILKKLLEKTDKNAIKVYLILTIQCDVLKNTGAMTNYFICEQLGYSIKAKNNLENIGKWTKQLKENGFIEKTHSRIYGEKNNRKIIEKINSYYKIISF